MDSLAFASAYRQQEAWSYNESHSLRREIIGQSADQANRLSSLLLDSMEGKYLTPEQSHRELVHYETWVNEYLFKSMQLGDRVFEDDPDDATVDRFFSIVNPHVINDVTLGLWQYALQGESPPKHVLKNVQLQLATLSVSTVYPLHQKHKNDELYDWVDGRSSDSSGYYRVADAEDAGVMGLCTEIDAGVFLLDVALQNPGCIPLPAPAQFDFSKNNTSLNCDWIIVNPGDAVAGGFQVKMNLRNYTAKGEHSYDNTYIDYIDGMNDLKNYSYKRKPSGGDSAPIAMPGLYSAHYLDSFKNIMRHGSAKGKNVLDRSSYAHTMVQTQQKARNMIHGTDSVNEISSRLFTSRVLQHLTKGANLQSSIV